MSTEEDTFDESDETFTVTISSPSGGGGPTPTLGTTKVVTTTIDDDDDAISGITLSVNPSSVGEDDAKTEFTVTASLGGTHHAAVGHGGDPDVGRDGRVLGLHGEHVAGEHHDPGERDERDGHAGADADGRRHSRG